MMGPKKQFLQWDHHRSHLQTMFSHQLDQGRFCDVTLAAGDGGQTMNAHRSVLCATSGYFDAVLNNVTSQKETLVIMRDYKFDDLKLLIDFMYNGQITVEQGSLASLKKTANDLQVHGLTEALDKFAGDESDSDASSDDVWTPQDDLPVKKYEKMVFSTSPSRKKRGRNCSQAAVKTPKMSRIESGTPTAANYQLPNIMEVFLPQPELRGEPEETDDDPTRKVSPKTGNSDLAPLSCEDTYYDDDDDNDSDVDLASSMDVKYDMASSSQILVPAEEEHLEFNLTEEESLAFTPHTKAVKHNSRTRLRKYLPRGWTDVLFDLLCKYTEIQCIINFKRVDVTIGGEFSTKGQCPECEAQFRIKSEANRRRIIIYQTKGTKPHSFTKKRRNAVRKKKD